MNTFNPKTAMLGFLSSMIALPLRIASPVMQHLRRIFYLGVAKAALPGLHASVQLDGPIIVTGTARITIGNETRIGGDVELGTEESGELFLGRNVRINRGSTLFAYDKLSIGDDTLIGEFVTIRDANHGIAADAPVRQQGHIAEAIEIGSDVWIGRGAVILPGVTIGNGAIIGANSVVTRPIEAGMIAVGSPARVIKPRSPETTPLKRVA
jgi:acetyltransferase-like isoleucine patch superfamily enzyme